MTNTDSDEKQTLVFTNSIPEGPATPIHYATTTIRNFTATGRPFDPSTTKSGSGLASLNAAEAIGSGHPDMLPRRYNDDSLISIPVLPPDSITATKSSPTIPTIRNNIVTVPSSPTFSSISSPKSPKSPIWSTISTPKSPTWSTVTPSPSQSPPTTPISPIIPYHPATTIVYADLYSGVDPIKHERPSLKFWHRRKSSASSSVKTSSFRHSRTFSSSGQAKIPEFVMKQVTRGEYLKHYAKDEQGKYIGSEDPAKDCILRNADDLSKWRAPGWEEKGIWRNDI